jgi:hypothetical protein
MWENITEMYHNLVEWEGMYWIYLVQSRDKRGALVNLVNQGIPRILWNPMVRKYYFLKDPTSYS